jgi:hypothetical protein
VEWLKWWSGLPSKHEAKFKSQEKIIYWAPVAQACNPSYSGGRDQEDRGSSQPRQIVQKTLSQKSLKRAGGEAQGIGHEFKLQYCKENCFKS